MLGLVYSLVALSYTLVVGVLGVLNIAITEMFTLGAYLTLLFVGLGIPFWVAGPLAVLGAAVASVGVELIGCRPLRDAPPIMPLLATAGLAIFIENIVIKRFGSEPVPFKGMGDFKITWGGLMLTGPQLLTLSATLVMLAALYVLVYRCQAGQALRAVAENRSWAGLLGIDANRTVVLACFVSGLFAGAAGFLVANQYAAISPLTGLETAMKGVAVIVIGGMGNVWGAVLAGLILGVAEVVATVELGSTYRDMIVWGALFLVLIVRPQGLFGSALPEAKRV